MTLSATAVSINELVALAEKGFELRFHENGAIAAIVPPANGIQSSRSARNRRYYERLKTTEQTTESVLKASESDVPPPTPSPSLPPSSLSPVPPIPAPTHASPPTPPPTRTGGGITEGRGSDKIPTTPQSKRIATIFHRKLTTPWTDKEIKAYKALGTIPEDDLAAVEQFYAENWPPQREMNCLRHDLLTFLNNFPGEVGKANAAKLAKPVPANRPFQQRLPTGL